jgi:hypothetical protein
VLAGRLAGPLLFGVTEVWAVFVVLTQIRVSGVQAAALALVVSGVLVAMSSEWHEVRSQLRRDSRQSPESATGSGTSEVSDAGRAPAQLLYGQDQNTLGSTGQHSSIRT